MNEHYNEEMAWRQLQDLQRELENHRVVDGGGPPLGWWLSKLARRVWVMAGLASRRAPRWNPAVIRPAAEAGRRDRPANAA